MRQVEANLGNNYNFFKCAFSLRADSSDDAVYGVALRQLACRDCWFESRPGAWMFVSCEYCLLCRYRPLRRGDPSCRAALLGLCLCR